MTSRRDDLDVALRAAALGAAELASRYRPSGVRETARSKGERRNLVTDADRAAEDAVLSFLAAERPGEPVVAEETASAAREGARIWYVDPLDGTNNFAHGIPLFCTSVGLVEDGRPVAGVVHAPVLGEIHAGAEGLGTTLSGEPVRVSTTRELADCVLATGFAYDRENLRDDNLDNFKSVLMRVRGLRRGGSAALDLAWVACGRFDGFWELWLNPWDVAAGAALVAAAGGRVSDMVGGDDWLWGRHLAATNGLVHDELLAALARPSFA